MEAPSSLLEYVEAQDRLDREAREMFPYDFSSCSMDQGYVKQQVFACKTCRPTQGETQHGGVCYSCSITCHGEHELVELFDRRAFKCDCGTARMGDETCNIRHDRCPVNTENNYNDNFINIFCFCKADYDPINEDGTMFQCLLCEDWFHDRCIKEKESIPEEEDSFEHYLCRDCVGKEPWLKQYRRIPGFCVPTTASSELYHRAGATDDLKRELTADEPEISRKKLKTQPDREGVKHDRDSPPAAIPTESVKESDDEDDAHDVPCKLVGAQEESHDDETTSLSLFLPADFRDSWCKCPACRDRVARHPALASEEPVYDPPEDDGNDGADDDDNDATTSTYDAGSRAMASTLMSMPRDKAIEGLLAFNRLKDHITSCLKPLAENGEIVTSEHVRSFFEKG